MSNRRGPHVIARPRKRAEITTTEIDTNKLAELIAAAPQSPPAEVKLGRATTRAVSDDAMAEIMAGQQTRVAPPPPAPPRLAHTKRRADGKRSATEGESFDDPTTVHTRTTGSIPVERATGSIPVERATRPATVKAAEPMARGSKIDLPSADDISGAVSMLATTAGPDLDDLAAPTPTNDSPTRPSRLADGSNAMAPVEPAPVADPEPEEQPAGPIPRVAPMRAYAIALSGVLAAAVVAVAWWLVH